MFLPIRKVSCKLSHIGLRVDPEERGWTRGKRKPLPVNSSLALFSNSPHSIGVLVAISRVLPWIYWHLNSSRSLLIWFHHVMGIFRDSPISLVGNNGKSQMEKNLMKISQNWLLWNPTGFSPVNLSWKIFSLAWRYFPSKFEGWMFCHQKDGNCTHLAIIVLWWENVFVYNDDGWQYFLITLQ